ncbi:MAG: deoxyribose-phosphate aldolase [Candidatus Bipolaricaulia bacterium]
MKKSDIAALIDHTALGPESSKKDVERVCREAKEHGFASVCIEPIYVSIAGELLKDTEVKVDTVVGFPHGTHKRGAKGFEAQLAIEDGADELDTVVNIPALQRGDYEEVSRDIAAVTEAAEASARTVLVKVILEMGLLDEETKRAGCVIAQASGADFVKTSTGFGPSGATVEDVELMSSVVSDEVGVKAAGGIGDFEAAKEMIEAGATRIGASSGVEIVQGAPEG